MYILHCKFNNCSIKASGRAVKRQEQIVSHAEHFGTSHPKVIFWIHQETSNPKFAPQFTFSPVSWFFSAGWFACYLVVRFTQQFSAVCKKPASCVQCIILNNMHHKQRVVFYFT